MAVRRPPAPVPPSEKQFEPIVVETPYEAAQRMETFARQSLLRRIAEERALLDRVGAWANDPSLPGPYRVIPHMTDVEDGQRMLASARQKTLDRAPDAPPWGGTLRLYVDIVGGWYVVHLSAQRAVGPHVVTEAEARRIADAVWPVFQWWAPNSVTEDGLTGSGHQLCQRLAEAMKATS